MTKPPTEKSSTEGRWLTVAEAAERVGVTTRTIFRWMDDGLRVARRGRVTRIWSADLDAFLRGDH